MPIYIAIGSNLGDRRANLIDALGLMSPDIRVVAVSALYESPPQPPAPPPNYLNAAIRVSTDREPLPLLRRLKQIERALGRRSAEHWAPRPIDLDIALYDGRVINRRRLVVPHTRLVERAFVLRPLLDLDADLRHPVSGERLDALLQNVGMDGLVKEAGIGWQTDVPI